MNRQFIQEELQTPYERCKGKASQRGGKIIPLTHHGGRNYIEGILGRDFAGERALISPVEMRIVKAFTENATIPFLVIYPLEIKRPKNKVMSTNVFMAVLLL